MRKNIDEKVVADFGNEWGTYTQFDLSEADTVNAFNQYFSIFPFDQLPPDAEGFDMGCGSGRWADLVAPRVGTLNCVEPSERALEIARRRLSRHANCRFFHAGVGDGALPEGSQDFGYCLGVLHHIPDTRKGIEDCGKLLKSGAPFLLYLYYDFENRPAWFRTLWRASDILRRRICTLPFGWKKAVTTMIAALVYLPLSLLARLIEKAGMDVSNLPLADYRNKPFYSLRTDALDRFGTRLEQRFSRADITSMLADAGFERIVFSPSTPHWVCLSYKR